MLRTVQILLVLISLGAPLHAQGTDSQIETEVQKALSGKRFSGIQSTVAGGTVTLTGKVDLYATKEEAERKIHHKAGVVAVSNRIIVADSAESISDIELRNKLAEKLAYDRVGYGTTTFNSFSIGVQNGVVTLGGTAYGPQDKDSAISLVENYPGVKDVIDDIEVAPVSMNDDRIRVAAARAIYGFPSLNRYALDPAKPIRITVVNGNITLTGVVDSQADKDAAGIRANGVPGAFKVTNNLQVASHSAESR
jgi:hyperosmotically inducible protein